MAILIDPARWPAHGTLFSHLVSDTSLEELHAFADRAGIPPRAFDHDHYDVAQWRYAELVALGAVEVSAGELVRRLVASGLRVRTAERTPKRARVLPGLRTAWVALLPDAEALGDDLLRRWTEPHRHYHDVRHLAHCLAGLQQLGADSTTLLAAWFHDAVYEGRAGADEEASARLAEAALAPLLPAAEVAEVARLVRLTAGHLPDPGDLRGAQLVDADLSVLALPRARYHVYLRDVRLEYPQFTDAEFRRGRAVVVERLLALDPLFHTPHGATTWADPAARNLTEERERLRGSQG